MKCTYTPKTVDVSDVNLPEDLTPLGELIAENTHDTWAASRIAEGWMYGPQRDDARKTHPDLVPYADLTEEEKEYDRRTSVTTIKLILKLGYEIKRAK